MGPLREPASVDEISATDFSVAGETLGVCLDRLAGPLPVFGTYVRFASTGGPEWNKQERYVREWLAQPHSLADLKL
jgi:hypothetical protein